jgi:hypothetical protein
MACGRSSTSRRLPRMWQRCVIWAATGRCRRPPRQRSAADAVRVGPLSRDEPAVPAQGRTRGDHPEVLDRLRQQSDRHGQDRPVGPVRPRLGFSRVARPRPRAAARVQRPSMRWREPAAQPARRRSGRAAAATRHPIIPGEEEPSAQATGTSSSSGTPTSGGPAGLVDDGCGPCRILIHDHFKCPPDDRGHPGQQCEEDSCSGVGVAAGLEAAGLVPATGTGLVRITSAVAVALASATAARC